MSFTVLAVQLCPFGLWEPATTYKEKRSLASSVLTNIVLVILLGGNAAITVYLAIQAYYVIKETNFNKKSGVDGLITEALKASGLVLMTLIAYRGCSTLVMHLRKVKTGQHRKLIQQAKDTARAFLTDDENISFKRRINWTMAVVSAILFFNIVFFFTASAMGDLSIANKTIVDYVQLFPDMTLRIPYGVYYGLQICFFYWPLYLSILVNVFVVAFGSTANVCMMALNSKLQNFSKEILQIDEVPVSKFNERPDLEELMADFEKIVEQRSVMFEFVTEFNRIYGAIMGICHTVNLAICLVFVFQLVAGDLDQIDLYSICFLASGLVLFLSLLTVMYIPLVNAGEKASRFGHIVYLMVEKIYHVRFVESGDRVYCILKDFYATVQLFPFRFSIGGVSVNWNFFFSAPMFIGITAVLLFIQTLSDDNDNAAQRNVTITRSALPVIIHFSDNHTLELIDMDPL